MNKGQNVAFTELNSENFITDFITTKMCETVEKHFELKFNICEHVRHDF